MSSAISAIANARISPWVPGTTRAFAAGGNNSGAEAASSGVDVLLSSRMDRLLQDFGSATSNTNGLPARDRRSCPGCPSLASIGSSCGVSKKSV